MVQAAQITVVLAHIPDGPALTVNLPSGTPAGGIWGHLPEPLRDAGPPDGVRYRLNGMRTIPGAPLRDGDTLEIAADEEDR